MAGRGAKSGAAGSGVAAAASGSPITLVFVDLVNSTALKAALPGSDVTARNRAYFETILTPYRQRVEMDLVTFGGRVVNTWGDDQFLIFPSAAQAAQWAVTVQTRQRSEPIATPLGPLQVRIGMHTGAPLADAPEASDYVGHEVDYAQRVSALASGGQILLSETTAALVRDARIAGLALHAHGEHDLKGIGRVPLFELLHGEKRPQPLEVAAPLRDDGRATSDKEADEPEGLPATALLSALNRGRIVGREAELAELRRRVDAALQGIGATVFLSGEPGIGKTRLASETALYARLQGFQVLIGRCEEEGAAPYQPFAQAVREYLNSADPARLEAALPPPVACELVRIVPSIAGQVKDVPRVPPLPAEQARQALLEAAEQFFGFITTQEMSLLLFLDDLHWAEEGSLALLHHLARQGKHQRLLIVGTYRDVELDTRHPLERTLSAMNRERLYQRLSLRRLPEAGVGEMVAALLAEASPPTPFISALYHETEGNPFFIEEVLKHLVEGGAIFREDGRWQIKPLEEFSVPQSIKVTIGRRLERLSEESREALTLAAVIGQQFSFDALRQASELEEERLVEITEEWLGAHLVVEERRGREELYRFQHALVREVLYDEVSLRRRARLHERVGLALEAVCARSLQEHLDELAHHFAQARGETAMEKGVDYCLRAGGKAGSLYAHEEAIRHLTMALELLDGLPEDEPHLRKRWDVVHGLRRSSLNSGALERAQEVTQEYLALAEQVGSPWAMAAAHFTAQDPRKCLKIAEEHGLAGWQAWARERLALDVVRDDPSQAEALLRGALQAPEALRAVEGFPMWVVLEAYALLMNACALQGKWDAVAAALRQSIPFGRNPKLFSCLGPMEEALNQAGKQAEFIAFCEEAKRLYAQAGLPSSLSQWYLEPATPSEEFRQLLFRDDFDGPELRPEWQWQDPIRVSSYSLSERRGHLTLRAGRGTDLHPGSNLNAPRMLLEVRGDFALETKMEGDWHGSEIGMGGLLIWKDVLSFVRLDKFSDLNPLHHGDVSLEARDAEDYRVRGRGLLRGDVFHLRLERTGERFAALCSTDGVHWLTCGYVDLPVKDPLRVGVWAAHGMVVHFDSVQVLGRG